MFTRELDILTTTYGKIDAIVSENGTELTSLAFLKWCQETNVEWHNIAPGQVMQNGFVKRYSGSFKGECMYETLFPSLPRACKHLTEWKEDYNKHKPHSSLGNITLVEYAAVVELLHVCRRHQMRITIVLPLSPYSVLFDPPT